MESTKLVHAPYVPPFPPNPNGKRYTVKELLHLGDNLPYIFCYVSAFKTPAFEFGVFRPGVNNKDKGGRRPRTNSMTCNTKGIPRPNFQDEDAIIAASKTFEEEEFKKMLSDDALKAWNSGPARLAHPRSGEKALTAFKSLPGAIINKNGNQPVKAAASASGGEPSPAHATTAPRKAATVRDVSPSSIRKSAPQSLNSVPQQMPHAPRTKSIGGQPMGLHDPLSASMSRNTANMHYGYGTGAPPIAALMDPRALSGLFGRQPMAYIRPDPYSQAHFYGPTSMTPNQYTQAAMGMMEDVNWMAMNQMAAGQQSSLSGQREMGGSMGPGMSSGMGSGMGAASHMPTTGATYPNVPYQTWYLRELDREAERLSLGLARQTQEESGQRQGSHRRI